MTKHGWKKSMKQHFAHGSSEELENNRNDIDTKVGKMLKLVREEHKEGDSLENSSKGSELVNLVEDFQKQYQSLYALYDNLTGEQKKEAHNGEKTNDHSSSSSSSDSESDVSNSKGRRRDHELQNLTTNLKLELDATSQKLIATRTEKEELSLKYLEALRKIDEVEKNAEYNMISAAQLEEERLQLRAENTTLNLKVEAASNLEAELNQRLKDTDTENEALKTESLMALSRIEEREQMIKELEVNIHQIKNKKSQLSVENDALKLEVESVKQEVSDVKQQLESAVDQIDNVNQDLEKKEEEKGVISSKYSDMADEVSQAQKIVLDLTAETTQLKAMLEERDSEVSSISKLRDELENESSTHVKVLEAQVAELQGQVDILSTKKSEVDEKCENKSNEAEQLGKENLMLQQLHTELQNKLSELERISNKREIQLSLLVKKNEDSENNVLAQIKNFTESADDLQVELEILRGQKNKLEEQNRTTLEEFKQFKEKTLGHQLLVTDLQARESELESILEQSKIELSEVLKKLEDSEKQAAFQSKNLMAQVNSLQLELESVCTQRSDLESEIQKRNQKVSECKSQMEILNGELSTKIADQQKMLKDQEELVAQINNLQLELETMGTERCQLELKIKAKNNDAESLKGENGGLQLVESELLDKIVHLERELQEREDEVSSLHKKQEDSKLQASAAQMQELTVQIDDLKLELSSVHTLKNQLDLEIEKRDKEVLDYQMQIGIINDELAGKIVEQERMVEEQEARFNNSSTDHKQLEESFQEPKENLQVAEKKMNERVEEFHMEIKSKDEMILFLQNETEELNKDIETRNEEVNKLRLELSALEETHRELQEKLQVAETEKIATNEEKKYLVRAKDKAFAILKETEEEHQEEIERLQEEVDTIEVKLRLSNQKLRVTEQLLTEKEEFYGQMADNLKRERKELENRLIKLSKQTPSTRDSSVKAYKAYSELDLVFQKFEHYQESLETCISEISHELQLAKDWVSRTNSEKQELEKQVASLFEEVSDKREEEYVLQQRLSKLEVVLKEEQGEKERVLRNVKELGKRVDDLEKNVIEKAEELSGREEEKREAIRQLCLWIEYKNSYCDDLKQMVLNMSKRRT